LKDLPGLPILVKARERRVEIGGVPMLVCTTWKARPLSPEQTNRLMQTWGKLEAAMAENPSIERVGWYIYDDGSGGVEITKATDVDAANAFGLESSLALGEFLEFDSRVVLDLESAMGPINKALELLNS
jgi:hypothetical protein